MGVSFLLYYTLLRKESNFTFNRFYLLATLILALSVPVFNFSSTHAVAVINKININTIYESHSESVPISEEEVIGVTSRPHFTVQDILLLTYILVAFMLMLRFVINLFRVVKAMKKKGKVYNGLYIVFINNHYHPYSFFNSLFIHKEDYENKEYFDSLFEHEKIHSRQLHSIDIIITELCKCFLWFNPFVWLYKKVISENHEYIADAKVIGSGYNHEEYLNQMIRYTNNEVNSSILISGFSYKHTKKRIIMLHKSKNPFGKNVLKLFLVVTLAGAFFTLNSFKTKSVKSFLVVVDAGHGGQDDGAVFNHIHEKDINLGISTKLAGLSGNDNINIVLLRSEDQFLSLEDRAKVVNELKPDLLLSIHCNYAKNSDLEGTTIFYSDKESVKKQSYSYGKTILSEHLKNVTDKGKIETADLYILENSECPALLINLGYLSNEHDLSLLIDDGYQDQIAESVYNSIVKIIECY